MKKHIALLAITAIVMGTACKSQPKEEVAPTPTAVEEPTPAPTPEVPKTDLDACLGKAAKDSCAYTPEGAAEITGTCARSADNALKCVQKKEKKSKKK